MYRVILCLAVMLAPLTANDALKGPPDDPRVVAGLRMSASTVAIPAYAKGKVIMVMFQRDKARDENLAALKGLRYVSTVILEGPGITDDGLKHLAGITTLGALNVSKTSVTGSGFAHLRQLRNLKTIMLDGSAVTDKGFALISAFRGMERIQASSTKLTGQALKALAGLTKLKHLDLPKTAVDDAGLAHLRRLNNLEYLRLNNTKVTGSGVGSLRSLRSLRYLGLSGCPITPAGFRQLRTLKQLEKLSLNGIRAPKAEWLALYTALGGVKVYRDPDKTSIGPFLLQDKTPAKPVVPPKKASATEPEGPEFVGAIRKLHGWPKSVSWSPDGKWLVSGNDSYPYMLFDAHSGKLLRTEDPSDNASGWQATFTPDGNILATCKNKKTVRLYDRAEGLQIREFAGHKENVTCLGLSPCGKRLAAGAFDGTVKVWLLASGKELLSHKTHSNSLTTVAFSPDGKLLASAGHDGVAVLWDVDADKKSRILTPPLAKGKRMLTSLRTLAWHPGGKQLIAGGHASRLYVWDAETGKLVRTMIGHTKWILAAAYCPKGETIASGDDGGTVRLWNANGRPRLLFRSHSAAVTGLAWSPDGTRLASCSNDQSIRIRTVKAPK